MELLEEIELAESYAPTREVRLRRVYLKACTSGRWRAEIGTYSFTLTRSEGVWRVDAGVVLPLNKATTALRFDELYHFEEKARGHYSQHFKHTLRFLRWAIDSGIPEIRSPTRSGLIAALQSAIERDAAQLEALGRPAEIVVRRA